MKLIHVIHHCVLCNSCGTTTSYAMCPYHQPVPPHPPTPPPPQLKTLYESLAIVELVPTFLHRHPLHPRASLGQWNSLQLPRALSTCSGLVPSKWVTIIYMYFLVPLSACLSLPGQHNDARMNIALGLTAAREGAHVGNHVEVMSLIKEKSTGESGETEETIRGAHVRDMVTGKEWDIRAKVVVNATGWSLW